MTDSRNHASRAELGNDFEKTDQYRKALDGFEAGKIKNYPLEKQKELMDRHHTQSS